MIAPHLGPRTNEILRYIEVIMKCMRDNKFDPATNDFYVAWHLLAQKRLPRHGEPS